MDDSKLSLLATTLLDLLTNFLHWGANTRSSGPGAKGSKTPSLGVWGLPLPSQHKGFSPFLSVSDSKRATLTLVIFFTDVGGEFRSTGKSPFSRSESGVIGPKEFVSLATTNIACPSSFLRGSTTPSPSNFSKELVERSTQLSI
ncbi:hypothetical protein PanWU01x14_242140 [Parasponia andersonii]|uniref:Uncharacterized protein n=1 Tax=Parasponia andersonii TaxID=3476 RepID=A0A2P5BG32_PARAD|nr:hypothetical protein PanWU01x14_242140 [Parasponia andersonii]